MPRPKSKITDDPSALFDQTDDLLVFSQNQAAVQTSQPPSQVFSALTLDAPVVPSEFSLASSQLAPQSETALTPLEDPFCPRQITFTIPGKAGVQVTATQNDGKIDFAVDVLGEGNHSGDLRGLFFHFTETKLGGLQITGGDGLITETQINANKVIDLGQGANMHGKADPFDVGIEFGTPGKGKDVVDSPVHFTVSNAANNLTLDDIAHLQFGARLTSSGDKITTLAPAAPDAKDDVFNIFEDGASGLDSPSKTPAAVVLDVLGNTDNVLGKDTDGDGDQLIVTAFHDGPSHGTVEISSDGHSVLYTPNLDYSGTDSFEYCVSDGHGGQDHALVNVNIAAVADLPTFTYKVVQGATINEMLINVTASENDADFSEVLDQITATARQTVDDGLPGGVTIVAGIPSVSADQPDHITQQFKLTLPLDKDSHFALDLTSIAKETSNGDQQAATQTINIDYDVNTTEFNNTFQAVDQGLWAPNDAAALHETGFIGIGGTSPISGHFDPPPIPLPPPSPSYPLPGPILVDLDANIKAGINYDLRVDTGSIDAHAPYATKITTYYNHTTDTLLVEPESHPLAGAGFETTSPTAILKLDAVFAFDLNVNISLLGVQTIYENNNLNIPETTVPIVELGTDDISFPVKLGGGFSVNFQFPTFNAMGGPATGTVHTNVSSNDIVKLDWDLVKAIPEVFAIPGEILGPYTVDGSVRLDFLEEFFEDILNGLEDSLEDVFGDIFGDDEDLTIGASFHGQISLLDAHLFSALKVVQDLTMNVNTLNSTLVPLENVGAPGVQFGQMISNASRLDGDDADDLIAFGVKLDPNASLKNDTDLAFDLGYKFGLLPITGSFDVLGQGTSFDLTPVKSEERVAAPIPNIDIYDKTFDLNFQDHQDVLFV